MQGMWNMLTCGVVAILLWMASLPVLGEAHLPIADDNWNSDLGYQSWIWDNRNYLYPILPISAPLSEDKSCRDDSRLVVNNLKNNTLWAMQSKFLGF